MNMVRFYHALSRANYALLSEKDILHLPPPQKDSLRFRPDLINVNILIFLVIEIF